MKTALNIIFLETGLVEDGIIRQEIDGRTGLSGLAHYGKQTVHQIHHGDTSFITVLIDEATTLDSYSQLCGKSIYHRGTYAVQTTAGLVGGIIEFTAGMKSREYQALRTDSFSCIPTGIPRPLSSTVAEPSASSVTFIVSQYPARCSSTELSTIS